MKNSVLETDRQTDREKSALVELRFAAKNDFSNLMKTRRGWCPKTGEKAAVNRFKSSQRVYFLCLKALIGIPCEQPPSEQIVLESLSFSVHHIANVQKVPSYKVLKEKKLKQNLLKCRVGYPLEH